MLLNPGRSPFLCDLVSYFFLLAMHTCQEIGNLLQRFLIIIKKILMPMIKSLKLFDFLNLVQPLPLFPLFVRFDRFLSVILSQLLI